MNLRIYTWLLIAGMMASLGAWLVVLFNIDPYESGIMGQILFFTSLFLFLSSIFVNALVSLRKRFLGEITAIETMSQSFRQGLLLALMTISLIGLNMLGYLVWWTGLLLIVGIFLIELFFLSRQN